MVYWGHVAGNGGNSLKKREIKYDLLRAVAVLAIITVHAIPAEAINARQWWFAAVMQPVLLCFVGIYFMLSGLFLLNSADEDITGFYKNRIRVIGIPFLLFSVLYYAVYVWRSRTVLSWWEYPLAFLRAFLTGTIPQADHLWFMYVIIALYLCTPFLARLMKSLKDRELVFLLLLMLAVQTADTYLGGLGLDMGNALQYMIFKGWLIYFVLGYALKRLCRRTHLKWFVLAGGCGLLLTLLQKRLTPGFTPGIHDLAPTMTAMTAAVFLLFENFGEVRQRAAQRAIFWLSRHSYSAYLIHYLILKVFAEAVVEKTVIRHFYVPRIVCAAVLTAVLSFVIAWILDSTVIRWIQNLIQCGLPDDENAGRRNRKSDRCSG